MKIEDLIKDNNVLIIYRLGSHVYGTNNENSDEDFIVVAKEYFDSQNINIHVYTLEQYKLALANHDIQALECHFLPYKHVLKIKGDLGINFTLDKSKLRVSISTIASNSFVKGKKKLTVSGDYDVNLAIKSVFHSLRILDFGIQIASEGIISNYSSMNWLLDDLRKLSEQYQRDELWNAIETKYKKLFNNKSSQFKALAPKNLEERDKKNKLLKLLNDSGLDSDGTEDLADSIMEIFK